MPDLPKECDKLKTFLEFRFNVTPEDNIINFKDSSIDIDTQTRRCEFEVPIGTMMNEEIAEFSAKILKEAKRKLSYRGVLNQMKAYPKLAVRMSSMRVFPSDISSAESVKLLFGGIPFEMMEPLPEEKPVAVAEEIQKAIEGGVGTLTGGARALAELAFPEMFKGEKEIVIEEELPEED